MPAPKGHPKWGGKPKGYKFPATLEKEHQEAILRERIAQDAHQLYDSLVQAATGVSHMMAKDRNGQWVEVTDPAIMAKVLNSGEPFYKISARNPDTRALINLFDRLVGVPAQTTKHVGHDNGPIVMRHELG